MLPEFGPVPLTLVTVWVVGSSLNQVTAMPTNARKLGGLYAGLTWNAFGTVMMFADCTPPPSSRAMVPPANPPKTKPPRAKPNTATVKRPPDDFGEAR